MDGPRFRSRRHAVDEVSPEELERFRTTLRRNHIWLRKLLTDPNRREDDLHLLVAARLRVLICNGSDGPALLDYARLTGKEDGLLVFGPYRLGPDKRPWPPEVIIWDPQDLRDEPAPRHNVPIERYLESYQGFWRLHHAEEGTARAEQYTVRDLIWWMASKEAVHHVPRSEELHGVRAGAPVAVWMEEDTRKDFLERAEDLLAEQMFRLGEWTYHAIAYVLDEPREPLN